MLLSFLICVVAIALEFAAVVLLLRNQLWCKYRCFFLYALWLLIANSALLLIDLFFRPIYPAVYWHIDTADIVLRLLVVWEVFRKTFPKTSGINRSLAKGVGATAVVLLTLACFTLLDYRSYSDIRSLHLALDRSFGFVQAIMVLGTLVIARYYGVGVGRNIRGIALGFGAWVSISTANNALADLTNSFLPYFYRLRPLTFVLMLVVWLWALRVYEPNPPIEESESLELNRWTQDWNRTISTARKLYGHD